MAGLSRKNSGGYKASQTQGGWIGAAIGAVASIAGGVMAGRGAQDLNRMSREEAQRHRNWQQMMSNTAHQREVRDLREAGLNPILSATGGPGASTPSGGMAPLVDEVAPALSSAQAVARTVQEMSNLRAANKQIVADTKKLGVETTESESRTALNTQAVQKIMDERKVMRAQIRKIDAERRGVNFENVGRGVEADIMDTWVGYLIKGMEKLLPGIGVGARIPRKRRGKGGTTTKRAQKKPRRQQYRPKQKVGPLEWKPK